MASGSLARSEKPFQIRLPPAVNSQSAVIVLRTKCDLKRLRCQIHSFLQIKINGRLIHMPQPLDRSPEAGTCLFEVFPCFRFQFVKGKGSVRRIFPVIQPDFSALAGLKIDQNINHRAAALHLSDIERPLVSLQKQSAEHLRNIPEEIQEKFPLIRPILLR